MSSSVFTSTCSRLPPLSCNAEREAAVVEVNEKDIKIDANHALAGKDLIFEIEVVEIA